MVAEVVSEVVLSLSALASSLSLASSMKNLMKKDHLTPEAALNELRKNASPEIAIMLGDPLVVSDAQQALIIDDELLEALSRQAINCRDKHIKELEKAKSQPDRIRANDEARACMCSVLRDIRAFNGKRLPQEGRYTNWWKAYGCRI